MRERIWWFVWGLLLVGNVLWWWRDAVSAGILEAEERSTRAAGDPFLEELVRQGHDTWARLLGSGAMDAAGLPEHPVLRRAEWLLRLREVEARLRAEGVEVSVADELENWLEAGAEAKKGAFGKEADGAEGYVSGIARWCGEWKAASGGARLVRLWLAPGRPTGYPEVQVEISGRPEQAGAQLLAADLPGSDWRWGELELWRAEAGRAWWLRGVLRYGGGE